MHLYWKVAEVDANNPRWPLWAMLTQNNGHCFVCPVTLNRDDFGTSSYEMANSSIGRVYLMLRMGFWCKDDPTNRDFVGALKSNPELLEKILFHAEKWNRQTISSPFLYWKAEATSDLPTWPLWAVVFTKNNKNFVVPVSFNKEDLDNGFVVTAPHETMTTLGKVYLLLGWGTWEGPQPDDATTPKWTIHEEEIQKLDVAWKNFLNGVPNKEGVGGD